MRYYVEQKYYDNGKTEVEIFLESEVIGSKDEHERYGSARPCEPFFEECSNYDLYVDVFESWERAEEFRKDTLNA